MSTLTRVFKWVANGASPCRWHCRYLRNHRSFLDQIALARARFLQIEMLFEEISSCLHGHG
jgi:hypothetical protein